MIAEVLRREPEIRRVLGVRCETSCGMLNDLELLNDLCEEHQLWFGVDAVSAFGADPGLCRFSRLAMVTGSSGKALAALPGIAILLLNENYPLAPAAGIPSILRLEPLLEARNKPGMVRNTTSSLLMAVLEVSSRRILTMGAERYRDRLYEFKTALTARFAAAGIEPLPGSDSPLVTAFRRPAADRWRCWIQTLTRQRVELYCRGGYLEANHVFEVAAMGNRSCRDAARIPLPEVITPRVPVQKTGCWHP